MSDTPVLDWRCSKCGANKIYGLALIPPADRPTAPRVRPEHSLPTLDWTCAHCGARQVYELVPMISRDSAPQEAQHGR
jgi:RNase P subunit RPR2